MRLLPFALLVSILFRAMLLDSKIPPNTLCVEAGPCIETPLSVAPVAAEPGRSNYYGIPSTKAEH